MAGIHEERDRAGSFGSNAERYDRTRPLYPSELVEWLSEGGVGTAADVGCGTGQLTRLLADRGWSIRGVEADARMAAVARTHGLDVDVSTFEAWPGPTGQLDLICSAQAWHWIDPTIGFEKAARHLVPGGTLALVWNSYRHHERVQSILREVHGRLAPALIDNSVHLGMMELDHSVEDAAVERHLSANFGELTIRRFDHEREQSIEDWTAECLTHSPVALLPDATRNELLAEQADQLRSAVGSTMTVGYTARVTTARRL